ncbi:23S rRNA pseudouridine(955/2504/2580) synthase RluC [Pantoea sp. Aalb]|uniref:23S rRNA pseudouridine(955/2504/2580) synthase RluC n=1 Tax=Pantoea sp. Aalb TaxID=2576762 RepID=UPI001326F294|nr:23S rRNA pseudouridine(955/2504/2580) synthase RluC [Pantoea sp. Aalb]MXP67468.1 23S rRNA pseudouridine(955/2504/2580) synthase RluC [Pantoea sp. Aalb]
MKIENFNMQFIVITDENTGQRIDNFLRTKLKGIPKSVIYRLVRKGSVRVNKKRIKPGYKLEKGNEVKLPPLHITKHKKQINLFKLGKRITLSDSILYEDDYILILNKPTGMAVHGGSGLHYGLIEMLRPLRSDISFLELVHRLDRDTSGVLMIAKKRSTLCALHEQLREKKMEKNYLALVQGRWPSNLKIIKTPLLKSILHTGEHIVRVSVRGKESETHFKVEERFDCATLVKARPITGRTHQIRVHMSHSGHAIAFDERYGNQEFNNVLVNTTSLSRLFLHAISLKFIHPNTGKILHIKAPLDNTLKNCLLQLRRSKTNHKLE